MMKVWVGPDGRTVATVGIEQALDYQLEAASSSADLSWRLASTAEWRGGYNQDITSSSVDILTCPPQTS